MPWGKIKLQNNGYTVIHHADDPPKDVQHTYGHGLYL